MWRIGVGGRGWMRMSRSIIRIRCTETVGSCKSPLQLPVIFFSRMGILKDMSRQHLAIPLPYVEPLSRSRISYRYLALGSHTFSASHNNPPSLVSLSHMPSPCPQSGAMLHEFLRKRPQNNTFSMFATFVRFCKTFLLCGQTFAEIPFRKTLCVWGCFFFFPL